MKKLRLGLLTRDQRPFGSFPHHPTREARILPAGLQGSLSDVLTPNNYPVSQGLRTDGPTVIAKTSHYQRAQRDRKPSFLQVFLLSGVPHLSPHQPSLLTLGPVALLPWQSGEGFDAFPGRKAHVLKALQVCRHRHACCSPPHKPIPSHYSMSSSLLTLPVGSHRTPCPSVQFRLLLPSARSGPGPLQAAPAFLPSLASACPSLL